MFSVLVFCISDVLMRNLTKPHHFIKHLYSNNKSPWKRQSLWPSDLGLFYLQGSKDGESGCWDVCCGGAFEPRHFMNGGEGAEALYTRSCIRGPI